MKAIVINAQKRIINVTTIVHIQRVFDTINLKFAKIRQNLQKVKYQQNQKNRNMTNQCSFISNVIFVFAKKTIVTKMILTNFATFVILIENVYHKTTNF